eukprot:1037211_1
MQRDVDSKESLEEETLKAGITQSEHGFIQWKITGDLLNQWKNAKYKKYFTSPHFNTMGGEWHFTIAPNGFNSIEDELILSYYVEQKALDICRLIVTLLIVSVWIIRKSILSEMGMEIHAKRKTTMC